MLWLIGIGGVWTLSCVMAVALCVMARRGDEQLSLIFATVPEMTPEVDFVATLVRAGARSPGVGAGLARVRLGRRRDELDDLELHQRRAVGDGAL